MLQVNDKLEIGPYLFTVRAVKSNRALFSWVEKTGITKMRWVIMRKMPQITKVA